MIIFSSQSADGDKKIASVNGDDIKAFRTKYYEEPIDELNDLNPKSDDVIGIFDKIKELENKGFDMLNMLPDVECTCCTQFKFYITTTIARAKEQTDYCVAKSVNKENRREMNVSWFFFLLCLFLNFDKIVLKNC